MPSPSETAKSAPQTPGVYIFRNSSGTPIYIGKAKNIRSQVEGPSLDDSRGVAEMVRSDQTVIKKLTDALVVGL